MECDVLIIGGGLAGLVAAHTAQRHGATTVLVDRGPTGIGTNSALSNAVFGGPTPKCTAQEYVRDTLETGRHINRTALVEQVAARAGEIVAFLRSLDLKVLVVPKNYIIFSSDPRVIPGVEMMKKLSKFVEATGRVRIVRGFHVMEILTGEGGACGVSGIDAEGKMRSVHARAVILAAGGAGALYLRNDNQKKMLGQGYGLAVRAGLDLWDMEFVQFYPLVMAEPGLPQLLVYPPYPKEVKIVSAAGEDVIAKYGLGDINTAIMEKRDEASARFFEEGSVYMDYRQVPTSAWGFHPLSIMKRLRFDFLSRPVAVAPAAHFCMGGVRTGADGQTDVAGLFACGEMVWGLHGANRMGGNALTECIVTGWIAGENAALLSRGVKKRLGEDGTHPAGPASGQSPSDFKEMLAAAQEIAWRHAGIVRTAAGMREGLQKLEALKKKLSRAAAGSPAERIRDNDLSSALISLEAILTAGLGREESRGSCIRSDFPAEDNAKWKKNSHLRYAPKDARFAVTYHPAT